MAEVAEGVRRIETVEAAKEVVDRWFESWPKFKKGQEEIATSPASRIVVTPRGQIVLVYEVRKVTEGANTGQMLVEKTRTGFSTDGDTNIMGSVKNTLYDEENFASDTIGRTEKANFIATVQDFLDEIEGVQGETEGSALPDENLPAVATFQARLEEITRNPNEDSDGSVTHVE